MNLADKELWMYVAQDIAEKAEYIPAAIGIGVLGFAFAAFAFRLCGRRMQNPGTLFFGLIYLPMVLILTYFEREAGSRQGISLVPFETLGGARANSYVLENVLLFLPFGILMAGTFKPMRRLWLSLLAGAACSLCIEVTQLITQRGYFQVDDILMNSIGSGIGCVLLKAFRYLSDIRKAAAYHEDHG